MWKNSLTMFRPANEHVNVNKCQNIHADKVLEYQVESKDQVLWDSPGEAWISWDHRAGLQRD